MQNRISVLIRTFNSEKTLGQVLSGIRLQDGDEYVVVDSGSTDSTLEIAKAYGAKIHIAPSPFNYSKSLNIGFKAAQNPWVLVISSHCIPIIPDFLQKLRQEFALLPEDVVVAYGVSSLSGKSDSTWDSQKTTLFSKADFPKALQICNNANSLYRRNAWLKLSFDETKKTAEDHLWLMEMAERGFRFAYFPTAKAVNQNQGSLRYMFWKGYRDSRWSRNPKHTPMSLYCLGGALKKLLCARLKREIDWGNFFRYGAHSFGQFFGSRQSQDNSSNDGASGF